jgi:hypothetical protein
MQLRWELDKAALDGSIDVGPAVIACRAGASTPLVGVTIGRQQGSTRFSPSGAARRSFSRDI